MADPKSYVQSVSVKQDTGELGQSYPIGVNFSNVIDTISKHTLKQFFDHYMRFMENADFIYYSKGEKPENHRIRIWVDTSEKQNVFE